MAVRNDFAPGEVLAAADLNDTFASRVPFAFGTATPTTTENGFLWYDSTGAPSKPTPKFWDGSAFVPLGGKVLQVVRATDLTNRTTSSTTYVDASISVTITPKKSDSAIMLIWVASVDNGSDACQVFLAITDSSNNAISGGQDASLFSGSRVISQLAFLAYATPATTSATTYKGRFRALNGTGTLNNAANTGQLFAIEVSA